MNFRVFRVLKSQFHQKYREIGKKSKSKFQYIWRNSSIFQYTWTKMLNSSLFKERTNHVICMDHEPWRNWGDLIGSIQTRQCFLHYSAISWWFIKDAHFMTWASIILLITLSTYCLNEPQESLEIKLSLNKRLNL